MKKTDHDIQAILGREIDEATAYISSEIVSEQNKAMEYYRGEAFGNEVEGRSKVVSRDVLDTVEWMMPSLLRIFAGGDDVVEYKPRGPEDEAMAQQATEYLNFVFYEDNPGFLILHDWFKDALLQKVGVVKHWWEEEEEYKTEEYQGLGDDEHAILVSDDDVEVLEHTADEYGLHSVRIRRRCAYGRAVVEAVPPEEFGISSRAKSIETAPIVYHRVQKRRSDLIEEGYDRKTVEALPANNGDDWTSLETSRFIDETRDGVDSPDTSMEEVTVYECYARIDVNGDGVAELIKANMAGSGSYTLLDWEEVDRVPFSDLCPVRVPHKFYGMSVADLVLDIQEIKSTITRQILDNLYLTNNPEREVETNAIVSLDDWLTSKPGGLKRVKRIGASRDLVVPFTAAASVPILELLDGVKEDRTGMNSLAGAVDAEVLQNQTATAYNQAAAAASARVEMIARIFAETGVKDLFKNLLKLHVTHQERERVVRLRNQWVPINPRHWNAEMDVAVSVGLGHGNRDQQTTHLMGILAAQKEALAAGGLGMVEPKHIHHTLSKLVTNAGFKNVEAFFSNPENNQQPQQPKPDPEMAKVMAQVAAEKVKVSEQIQLEREKMQARIEMQREEMTMKMELKRRELEMEAELEAFKVGIDSHSRDAQGNIPTVVD